MRFAYLALLVGAVGLGSVTGAPAQEGTADGMTKKLQSIILPSVEFRATTLESAVEFLRQESRRLDPTREGANLLVKTPSGAAPAGPISLSLTRIPLLEALRYVAAQEGLKVRVEPYAALLVPLSDSSGPMPTAVFRVKPDFFSAAPPAPTASPANP